MIKHDQPARSTGDPSNSSSPTQVPDARQARTRRSALWAAYGDALGFVSELTDAAGLRRRTKGRDLRLPIAWDRRVGGRSGVVVQLPAGCYSDDTQLRLSTSRAIGSRGFDVEAYAKVELPVWLAYALGGGLSTKSAATNLTRPNIAWFANTYDGWASAGGNGAAMRIHPHVWSAPDLQSPSGYLVDVLRNSVCTHGHVTGIMGAVIHAMSVAQALLDGRPPSAVMMRELLDATREVPTLIRGHPELGELWLPMWQAAVGRPFDEAWQEAYADSQTVLDKAHAVGETGPSAYARLVDSLGLGNKASRGSGILTAIAAVAITWYEPEPAEALAVAANAIGTDTDTIATMAGAILGAIADRDPPGEILDAELICSEADRMTSIAAGKKVDGHTYPDLLHWSPPRNQADALLGHRGGLYVAGLGPVSRTISEAIAGPQPDFLWQWTRLEFGQTLLIKRRRKLAEIVSASIAAPRLAQGALPGLDTARATIDVSGSRVSRSDPRLPEVSRRSSPSAPKSDGGPRFAQGVDDGASGRALDIGRVIEYVERERLANDAVGYAVRRVAQEATPEQTAAFLTVILDRLRQYPPARPPARRNDTESVHARLERPPPLLLERAKEAIRERVERRVHSWAPVTSQEIDVLVSWIVGAIDDRSLEYTYPTEGVDGHAHMLRAPGWTASAITADGRLDTLRRVSDDVRYLVAEVRSWDIWQRIRPGPI